MFLQFNWGKSFLLKRFKYFTVLILILICSGSMFGQYVPGVNNNVQLLGTLSPAIIGGYGDIWGYVDPNTNKEYALLCARNEGLYIIEITDPSNPTVTSFVPSPPGSNDAKDVKTYLNFAYVVHQSGPLQIIDLSDPANPTDTTFTNSSLSNGFHNIFIDDAGFAYIAIQTGQAAGDMRIFDLTNPNQPVEVGVYFHPNVGQGFVESHDVYTRNDTAYVSYLEGGLVILDVTDRSNPQELAITNYPDNFTHSAWTTEDGRYVLTTDEVTNGHLMIWDIQDLGNISLVSEYESSPGIIIHNALVSDDFAYISYYVDGLRIVDLSDITQPTEVGYYDTFLQQGTSFDGAWGVYPFFPSGNIVISDLETGLYVVQFDTVRAGGIEGTVTDLLTGLPIPDVNVDFVEADKSVQTEQNGFYSLRTNEGNHTIIFSKPGYFSDTLSVTLPSGPSITQDVILDPNLADIEVSVDSLSMILPINTIATTDFVISNVGPSGRLDYLIDDINGPIYKIINRPLRPNTIDFKNFNFKNNLTNISRTETENYTSNPDGLIGDTIIVDPAGDLIFGTGGDVIGLFATVTSTNITFELEFLNNINTDSAFAVLALDMDFDPNTGAFPGGFGFNLPAQNIGSEFDILVDVSGGIFGIPLTFIIFEGSNSPGGGQFIFQGNISVNANILSITFPLSAVNDDPNMLVAGFTGHIDPNVGNITSIDYLPDVGNGTVGVNPFGDLPWLALSLTGGTLFGGESDLVTVTFDTNDLEKSGVFSGIILITSNDPDETVVIIPVTLLTEPVIGIDDNPPVPEVFALEQNYPNPFNPSTTIKYQIPELSIATIKVYDVLGSEIVTLVNEEKTAGNYKVEFDATGLPSGVYIYRLIAGSFTNSKKMILLR